MQANFLGLFLLEKGLISDSDLQRAIALQRAANPLLGELAISLGMLSPEQTEQINHQQNREDKRFGDIATELGLLSDTQMQQLLSQQRQQHKYIGEILVAEGVLDAAQLKTELQLHQQQFQKAHEQLSLAIADHPLADIMRHGIEFCAKLFLRILKTKCHFRCVLLGTHWPSLDNTVHIPIDSNSVPFAFGLACNDRTVINIACKFMGMPADECDAELAQDAFGEFLNIVVGQMLSQAMPELQESQSLVPDFSRSAEDLRQNSEHVLAVEMISEMGSFAILITADEKNASK